MNIVYGIYRYPYDASLRHRQFNPVYVRQKFLDTLNEAILMGSRCVGCAALRFLTREWLQDDFDPGEPRAKEASERSGDKCFCERLKLLAGL